MASIRVLIIDDEEALTEMLEDYLLRSGFEVLIANSGKEGVALARTGAPDIIVLDLMMPGFNGWEVCNIIRTFSQVPILILTAATGSDSVMRALDEGANDYLVKPVPSGILVSHIKMLVK